MMLHLGRPHGLSMLNGGFRWWSGVLFAAAAAACGHTSDGAGGGVEPSAAGSESVGGGGARSAASTGGRDVLVSGGSAGASVGDATSGSSSVAGSAGAEAGAGQGGEGTGLEVELHIIEPLAKHLQRATQQGGKAESEVIAVSPDGTRVLARSTYLDAAVNDVGRGRFEEVVMWTAETGSVSLGTLSGDAEAQYSPYAYSEDLSRVAGTERRPGPVDRVFSWRTGEALEELGLPVKPDAMSIELSADGKVAVVTAYDMEGTNRLFRFDGAARTEIPALLGFASIEATHVSSDGASLYGSGRAPAACEDDCWREFVWQAGKGTKPFEFPVGAQGCGLTNMRSAGGIPIVARCEVEPGAQGGFVYAEGVGWVEVGGIPHSSLPLYLSTDTKAAYGRGYDVATSTDVMWRWTSGKGTELLQLPNKGKVNELSGVVAATPDGKTVLVETRSPVRAVLWTPDAVQVLPLADGATDSGAESMSDDARIITGYASGVAGNAVLWVDGEPLVLSETFRAAGVDLTGVELGRAIVSHDGHSMSGAAVVNGARRGWLARLN